MSSEITWPETLSIISELTSLYSNSETNDSLTITDLSLLLSSITSTVGGNIEALDREIGASEKVLEVEEMKVNELASNQHAETMKNLNTVETQLTNKLQTTTSSKQILQESIAKVNTDTQKMEEKMEELNSMKLESIPRLKHAISLYANISGIKFAYPSTTAPSSADGGVLTGQIKIANVSEVHDFNIDLGEMAEYEVSEYLWGVMDSGAAGGSEVCV